MNAKRKIRRALVTMLSVALLAVCTLMPAMAADPNNTSNTVTITKTINMDGAEGAGVPNATYTFNVTPADPADYHATESNAKKGVAAAIAGTPSVTFTGGTAESGNIVINFDVTAFNTNGAGIYYYTLTENEPSVAGIAKDPNTYVLKVGVGNNGAGNGLEIIDVGMFASDNQNTKTDTITNTYTTYDLTINKVVTGTMGDKTKDFTFTIQLTDPDVVNHMTSISYVGPDGGDPVPVSMENGTASINVQMKHDESITIKGLPVGTDYTITESDNAGYTVTYAGSTTNGTGEIDGDATVTVTNDLSSSPATGVIMNVAPYALMVVIAAVGAFVFLRKRAED